MRSYIGVDPGKKGGIAILEENGKLHVIPMPMAGNDINIDAIYDILDGLVLKDQDDYFLFVPNAVCVIEKVGAMPEQGVKSMFSFGYNVGMLHGMFGAWDIPRQVVTPRQWKKVVLAGTAKDKNAARDYCVRTFPNVSFLATERSRVPHDGMCDATCIAMYAKMKGL